MNGVPVAVPGSKPGELIIPALGNKVIQQVELREDDVYDTVFIAAGAIANGTEYVFFRDIANKNDQHCNLPQAGRIAAGDEVAVFRVGLHPREAIGNTLTPFADYKRLVGNASLDLRFNRRIITTGPVVKYPSGYGMAGFSNEAAAAGIAAASIGVPSVAAAPTLFVPQQLRDNDDIQCKMRFNDAAWVTGGYTGPTTTAAMAVSLFLRGVIKSPLGK